MSRAAARERLSMEACRQVMKAIYKWQQGHSLPTIDNLVALPAIFAVPIDAAVSTGDSGS